jgi:hypothetical protein
MTRRSYNWRTDPKYIMKEGHPNKMMRPSTHSLLHKLRNMKMMQEPGMANVVIYDLAYHFLGRHREEVLLGDITAKLMHMWVGMVKNEEGQAAYIYGQPENHPVLPREDAPLDFSSSPVNDSTAGVAAGGDSPWVDLASDAVKLSVKSILMVHSPGKGSPAWMIKCECGRDFAATEEWAQHVRVRIWRVLKNEFPPIGGNTDVSG